MSCGIYKIINKVNGKFYLGSSKDIETRWEKHRWELKHNRHHSVHLQRAWNKYGEENFIFEILENTSTEMLLEREQTLLDTLRPFDDINGYNMSRTSSGGDLVSYHPNIDAIKEKQRIATQKRWATKTEKEKLDYAEKLKMDNNPNWKGGISFIKYKCPICGKETGSTNKNTASCMDCADKSGENNSFFGKHHTAETKEKLRKINTGKCISDDVKKKCREASIRFYNSEKGMEYKQQLSTKISGENHPLFGIGHSDQSILKMSKSHKERYKNMPIEEKINKVINGKQGIKMVIANGKYFFSCNEAAKYFNVSKTAINFRCLSTNNKWKEFMYIDRSYVSNHREEILENIRQQLAKQSLDVIGN